MQNVLDDVVDKEAGAKPKLVVQSASGGVGSAIRHISQEELDAYVEGRLSGARLDFVRGHLDACEACRAELTDLRTFKASAVGMSQASSLKRELERRRRQRMLKTAATAAVAAAVVAVIGVVGWNKFGKAWVHTALAPATAAARAPAVAAAADAHASDVVAAPNQVVTTSSATAQVHDAGSATTQPRATPVAQPRTAGAVAAAASSPRQLAAQPRNAIPAGATSQPPAQARYASAAGAQASAVAQPRASVSAVTPAATVPQLAVQAHPATPPAAAPAAVTPGSTSFALLGPFGDEISDDRPEFAWQPLEGATKYSIIIVDEGLRPIAHTRLKTTTWRPHKPLRRGRTYLWQVTAILKNGTKVMAKGPTSQEARIHVTAPAK